MATLSMDNSNIIGISYSQMNSVKVSMKRAQQMLEISQRNVNSAKLQVQVDKGRLKVTEDSLWGLYSEASKRKTKIDKICNNIDYTIRRFKEVDSRCATSIRSIGKYYNSQLSMIDRIKNNFIGLKFSITSNLKTLLEEGASAFNFLKTKASEAYNAVSEFMEAHPWIGNTIGVIGGIGQIGVYALLLTPPFTPIGVAGMAFGFNSAVYSGTKLINNITNGSNEGVNVLENVFSLFGDGGKTAYNILDMGFAIATIPIEGGFALSKASQIATESNGAIKGFSALSKGIKEVEKMKVDKLSNIFNSTLGKITEPMSKVKIYFKNSFGEFSNFKSLALPEGFSINISKIDDASDSSKVVNKIGQISEDAEKVTEVLTQAKDYGKYSTLIDNKVKEIEKSYLPNTLSKTFTDSNYRTVITEEKIMVYRTFGGRADAGGSFVTTIAAESRMQAKIDTALLPSWGNSRMYEAVIEVPKGEVLNIGKVAEQITESGGKLVGGGDQVVLPLNWDLNWIKEIRLVKSK